MQKSPDECRDIVWQGYVQVYTGNGKGKTTAALGQALRAAGAGLKTFIGQFVKEKHSCELKSLTRFSDLITIRQYGRGFFMDREPDEADSQFARDGLEEVISIINSKKFNVVILDEINIATFYHLIPIEKIVKMIVNKPKNLELILTGRYADSRVIDAADLVTEMTVVKHYSEKGVRSRIGIEE